MGGSRSAEGTDPAHALPAREPAPAPALPRRLRGYDRAATDALLDKLAGERANLERECAELRRKVAEMDAELVVRRRRDENMRRTLLSATSQALSIREDARQEAELALRKARAEVEGRLAVAAQLEREHVRAEGELHRLRGLASEMQLNLTEFLTRTLERLEADTEAQSPYRIRADLDAALQARLQQEGAERRWAEGDLAEGRRE